jgi:uncharacterized protein (DUF1015 family)
MPLVRPFRGIGYALDRYGSDRIPATVRLPEEPAVHPGRVADLTDLVSPPFDVINADQRRALLERDPHNAVRLELSPEADPHAAAATALTSWLAGGVLERRAEPALYYYSHARPEAPDDPSVAGVLARVLLEPFGKEVRAHEHTMAGPKADRLGLLDATHTQLSPILAVYLDESSRYANLMSRPWTDEWRARDADGLLHTLAAVEPDDQLTGYLSRQQLYIADGHHRYETALAYKAQVRADPSLREATPGALPSDWVMMVLVNAQLEKLEIRATHRLIRDVDEATLQGLISEPGPLFQALPVPPEELTDRLHQLRDAGEPTFGVFTANDGSYLLIGDVDVVRDRMRREPISTVVQRLDLSVLHRAVLADRLGLEAGEAGKRILYTTDPADALARVRSGDAQAAFLVRANRMDVLAAVATAGDVMPEKATYFYPKLLTGMVFYPLEDE